MNHSIRNRRAGRWAAAAGAAALALVGAVAAAAPAMAATPYDLPDGPGSLTIHKFEQPSPVGAANDSGEPIDTTGLVALGNVEFTVYPITDIDLTTEAGWDLANDYAADPSLATALGTPIVLTTAADGSTPTQSLPNGAYLVVETDSSGATLPDGSPANVILEAAPFVVTVPVPLGNGEWNSDVNVYPKNSLTQVAKTVDDPDGSGLGSTVTWSIEATVPALPDGESFTEFHFVDTLDGRLEYTAPARLTLDGTPLTFTETHVGADAEGLGGTVTVTLDAASLAALEAAPGGSLVLELDTIVRGTGDIPNTGTVFINEPTTGNGTDTNTVNTYWGAVEILKHAEGDVNAVLTGAVFSVYPTEADANAGTNAIVVDGETTFTTAADGTVVIPGLWAGADAAGSVTYYLKELEAPDGYITSGTPIPVVVSAASLATPVEVAVPNPQEPAISLPLTGGNGTLVLMSAGVGLVALAVGLAVLAARRRRHADATLS
ncbi:SpaH/EbpB family LPXTG-anchored major pilin [Microbacterium sp. LjRoot45]|uniref:SpaH/EbpB family LPXTG-anchored major pilin n=1 Tax=Microbacterium sp. LjRoot45 TaxID=3342329 RepID=UPI003ED0236F